MGSTPRIRVLLAEDHETVRQGLKLLINRQRDMEVIGEAVTAMPQWNVWER